MKYNLSKDYKWEVFAHFSTFKIHQEGRITPPHPPPLQCAGFGQQSLDLTPLFYTNVILFLYYSLCSIKSGDVMITF